MTSTLTWLGQMYGCPIVINCLKETQQLHNISLFYEGSPMYHVNKNHTYKNSKKTEYHIIGQIVQSKVWGSLKFITIMKTSKSFRYNLQTPTGGKGKPRRSVILHWCIWRGRYDGQGVIAMVTSYIASWSVSLFNILWLPDGGSWLFLEACRWFTGFWIFMTSLEHAEWHKTGIDYEMGTVYYTPGQNWIRT